MAHYALLDGDNIVKGVYVIDDAWEADGEAAGVAACKAFFDRIDPALYAGTWIKTSYNGNIRRRFAGIGSTYNAGLDAFVLPKGGDDWTFDETAAAWIPPSAEP